MKQTQEKLILSIIALVLGVLVFNMQTKIIYEEKIDQEKVEATIKKIEEENPSATLLQKKEVETSFYNLVFEEEKKFKSYFVDAKNGKIIELKDILKKEQEELFWKKVSELLHLKYPRFIADVLETKNGDMAYRINEHNLMIYYSNFKITPEVSEELSLKVDYNEIKDYINFQVDLNAEYENENGYHYNANKKAIALTFDDGPNNTKTKKIVDLLSQNKMHGTFFMVGNRMASAPGVVNYVLEHQNEIGSHSYSHSNMKRLKKEQLIEEEKNTNKIYKEITGRDLTLLRPPYGNVNELMKETMNYIFINWNIDTEDWRYRNKDHIYNEVISKVEDGDIILMHDLYDSTIEAVEKLLPELYVRGFQVVTVTELANLKGKNLEFKKVYRSIK